MQIVMKSDNVIMKVE